MTSRPTGLPSFGSPPIDEVAIAVQFADLEGVSSSQIRDFWRVVRNDYPFIENQPTLDVPLESPESDELAVVEIRLASLPFRNERLWLISEADDYLIQVQSTRFIQNWRRRGNEYPHFEEVRDLFWRNFETFRDFLKRNGLPDPKIEQVEVTYINWVSELSVSEFLKPAGQAAIHFAGSTHNADLQTWTARYTIANNLGIPQRLHVQALPAVRASNKSLRGTQLSLVVRAANRDGLTDANVSSLVNESRAVIVEAFTELTTDIAHLRWERLS